MTSQDSPCLELDDSISSGSNEDIIKVRLKDEAVIKYLSEGIYTSWKSAVRELFANELTAALTAKEMARPQKEEKPTIEITLDPERRELIIQGIGSIGITKDTFAEKVIYYGRSGNVSSKRPGRFGFGLKSYVSLGKSIHIESYARETEDRYGVTGSEGTHFKRIPEEQLTISEYGTKISIILKDDVCEEEETEQTYYGSRSGYTDSRIRRKIIELDELIETIQNVCRFSDIDTYLTITSDCKITKHSSYSSYSFETAIKSQRRKKINFTPQQFAAMTIARGNQSPYQHFEFELDDHDFYFYGVLATSGRDENEVDVNSDNGEIRLLKMPIEVTIPREDSNHVTKEVKPGYPMTFWFVNLKDEVKFAPTPDRERLREGLYGEVHGKITEFLKGKFAEMEIKSFADYRNSRYKPILNSHSDRHLQDYLTDTTRQICSVLDTEVLALGEDDSKQETDQSRHWRHNSSIHNPKLREVVAKTENIFMLRRELTSTGNGFVLTKKTALNLQKLIRAKYPDGVVFLYPASYPSWRLNEALPQILELGRKLSDQFSVKDAKTEAASVKNELGIGWRKIAGVEIKEKIPEKDIEIVVWMCNRPYGSSIVDPIRVKPSEVRSNTLRIKGNMKEWIDLLKKYSVRDYGITKEIKGLTRGMSEEEFRDHKSKKKVATENGRKTLREVEKTVDICNRNIGGSAPFTVLRFHDPEILKFYKPKDSKIICSTTDKETFEAIAYLKLSNKEFKATDVVRKKDLKRELTKCCGGINEMEDREKSIFSLVGSEEDDEEGSWASRPDATNYLFMAVSMMNEKMTKRVDRSIGSLDRIVRRKKLVSLLWDSLSNLYDAEKMRLMVRTAVKYA